MNANPSISTKTQEQPVDEQPVEQSLESLCNQARVLATGLPGTLAKLTVMAGENRVEMEWQPVTAVTGGVSAVLAVEPEVALDEENLIVAPLVGTFYRSPEPDAAPFVTEGDLVEAGQQVAIVEAMKILNSVQADRAGRVAKIFAENGDMVEFGQPLMAIEPPDAEL
jgi:acetyl-CoA carboxylase biotin carboxyl carrier protein